MGLGSDLVQFFQPLNAVNANNKIVPYTIGDFYNRHLSNYNNPFEIAQVCRRLADKGILYPAGSGRGSPPLHECYYAFVSNNPIDITYGTYDFLAFGFPAIREQFKDIVFHLDVKRATKSENEKDRDSGSAFQIQPTTIVTAKHCIVDMKNISISTWDPKSNPLTSIHVSHSPEIDLAVLKFTKPLNPMMSGFLLEHGTILSPVMAMGYPPVSGFDTIQVAETANIVANLKSTTGQTIGTHPSYLGKQPLMLISARVKGGNSGGPAVNERGRVVGVVTDTGETNHEIDSLGFGIVTPTETLNKLTDDIEMGSARSVNFLMTEDGFSTI